MRLLVDRKWLIICIAIVHAALSALLWCWALAIAMGLGFKDKSTWTVWDHFQAFVVPEFAMTITIPGRFFLSGSWYGLLMPWLANSILWSMVLVGISGQLLASRSRQSST
jgi:hypothetical protein